MSVANAPAGETEQPAEAHRNDGEPQLTWRAVLVGVALGSLLCIVNVYAALRIGTSIGAGVTASIAGYGVVRAMRLTGLTRAPLGELENCAIASIAASASFMGAGGNLAALAAFFVVTGTAPTLTGFAPWLAAIALLGILAAILFKRRLVDRDCLPFPSGTAVALTIRGLHARDRGEARPRAMFFAAVGGALALLLRRLAALPAGGWSPSLLLFGRSLGSLTIALEPSPLFVGAGMLMGLRTGASLLFGAALAYLGLAPVALASAAHGSAYQAIVGISVWPSSTILVISGLLEFLLDAARRRGRADRGRTLDPSSAAECPQRWFWMGASLLAPLLIVQMGASFSIPWWTAAALFPLALLGAAIAARVVGETDTVPTKAFAPATQGLVALLLPGRLVPIVMGANVTCGVSVHTADMLTDWKTGALLRARPRPQLAAQAIGTVLGAILLVPSLHTFAPDARLLGSDQLPAPSVLVWVGVSQTLSHGFSSLGALARTTVGWAAAAGTLLVVAHRVLPPRMRRWVPTPAGVAMGMLLPAYASIAIFAGAVVAAAVCRRSPVVGPLLLPAVASGLIAGESLLGAAALVSGHG